MPSPSCAIRSSARGDAGRRRSAHRLHHQPAQKIADPVYIGGNSVEVLPGVYVALEGTVVDRVWRRGELVDEMKQGAWYVLEADAALAMRNPEGLSGELVKRLRVSRLAI